MFWFKKKQKKDYSIDAQSACRLSRCIREAKEEDRKCKAQKQFPKTMKRIYFQIKLHSVMGHTFTIFELDAIERYCKSKIKYELTQKGFKVDIDEDSVIEKIIISWNNKNEE